MTLVDAPADADQVVSDAPQDAPPLVWSTPRVLTELHANGAADSDPTISADRLTVVWNSDRAGGVGSNDLWIATRASTALPFSNITDLTAVNSTAQDEGPELSADGTTLYFSSARGTTKDIYVSHLVGGAWTAPTLVSELSSSTVDDLELALTPDGLTVLLDRAHKFYRAACLLMP